MPVIPFVQELPLPIKVARYPAGSAAHAMNEFFQAEGDTLAHIQAGSDAAEIAKLTGEGSENLGAVVDDAKRQQDKAKIDQAVRKGQDPKAIIQGSKAETKAKIDAIPQEFKDVLEYVH